MFDEEKKEGSHEDSLKELQEQVEKLQAQVKTMTDAADKPDAEIKKTKEPAKAVSLEKIDEPQKEEPVYETMFGDRRRIMKAGSRKFAFLLAAVVIVVIVIYAFSMIPSGFKVPSAADGIEYFRTASGYDLWSESDKYFTALAKPEKAKAAEQVNIIFDTDKKLYANILSYEFSSVDEVKEYLKEKHGEEPETRKLMAGATIGQYIYKAEDDGYDYVAWFTDSILIEVYATYDAAAAERSTAADWIRQAINRFF